MLNTVIYIADALSYFDNICQNEEEEEEEEGEGGRKGTSEIQYHFLAPLKQ
jgi:hypothetical protein